MVGHGVSYTAASYVGRIGALAVALGIGAAVAGGAGIARAEGPSDADSSGSSAQSSPAQSETDASAGGAQASTSAPQTETPEASDPSDDAADSPASPNVPEMNVGNGRDTTTPADQEEDKDAEAGPDPVPDVTASNVRRDRSHTAPAVTPRPADPITAAASSLPAVRTAPVPDDAPAPVARPALAEPAIVTKPVALQLVTITEVAPAPVNPMATMVSQVLSALGVTPVATGTGGAPLTPFPIVQAFLQLIHREIERFTLSLSQIWPAPTPVIIPTNPIPSVGTGTPSPTDDVATPYGEIGTWMLEPNGQISDYGGLPYGGKTVLEPVNVIIVDPTSSSAAESAWKLNTAMFWSGFPAQPIHSGGFLGTIDDFTYGQQPTGPLLGYSDNFFLFPNNHGRIFGPDPVETSTGYVWSGAFSTEAFVIYDFLPRHAYVSSNVARTALATRLIASGQATYGGMVPLSNAYETATTTTGDHDGYAVVIVLR